MKEQALKGVFFVLGMSVLGWLLGSAALEYKAMERTVTVKGLSEREVEANVVVWPITFIVAGNQLEALYKEIESTSEKIRTFLITKGIAAEQLNFAPPSIVDKSAQQYGGNTKVPFRYSANQTVSIYSGDIPTVHAAMASLSQLGKEGIVFTGDYQYQVQYLFTKLNALKPAMVEEATKNAREVAQKFAADSQSHLGKIRRASQGQFSIQERDNNNRHIKKIRVVSTVEYYLTD